jgi:hypothetical protein
VRSGEWFLEETAKKFPITTGRYRTLLPPVGWRDSARPTDRSVVDCYVGLCSFVCCTVFFPCFTRPRSQVVYLVFFMIVQCVMIDHASGDVVLRQVGF